MDKKFQARFYSNVVIAILIAICAVLSAQFALPSINGEKSSEISLGWTYTTKNISDPQSVTLPASNIVNPSGSSFYLHNTLPDEFFMGATLLLKTNHQTMQVFLEDEIIYSYGVGIVSPVGKSFGSSWHLVRLPSDFANKNITIKLDSKYLNFSTVADAVFIGTKSSHIFSIIRNNILTGLVGTAMLSIGLVVMVIYFILYRTSGKSRVVLYLSLIGTLSGAFILTSCGILQLILNVPLTLYTISVISMFLLPLPILYFVSSSYVLGKIPAIRLTISIHRTFVILAIMLHLLHLVDFQVSLKISHVLMMAEFAVCMFYCAKNRRKKVAKTVLVAFCILSASALINIIIYTINPSLDITTFIKYGMVTFIAIISFNAGQHIVSLSRSSAMNSALSQLAYNDTMTGLKNRAAFQEKLDYYEEHEDELERVSIAVADLNYLKCINDSLGHKKGDDLIIHCADYLAHHFGKIGSVYRIGGDEFAVIMADASVAQCNEALNAMKRAIKLYNKTNPTSGVLSIAVGIEHFNLAYDHNINDLFSRADSSMYSNKVAQKERKINILNGEPMHGGTPSPQS